MASHNVDNTSLLANPPQIPAQPDWHTELTAHFRSHRTPKIKGIVLHDTSGNGTHGDTLYLADPQDGRTVSVDFTVERDGKIWKLNPQLAQFYCFHAGRATQFQGLVNGQVNRATIGIEMTQKSDLSLNPIWPTAQVQACAELCAWLVHNFQLPASAITTHRNIITDGSRFDPVQFPFDDFWRFFWNSFGVDTTVAVPGHGHGL